VFASILVNDKKIKCKNNQIFLKIFYIVNIKVVKMFFEVEISIPIG